jgi:tetratricopeptide (TPR) repeat protein
MVAAHLNVEGALSGAHAALTSDPAQALHLVQTLIDSGHDNAEAHRLAAHALRRMGRESEAQTASLAAVSASIHDAEMVDAALALAQNRLPDAETALRARLRRDASDVAAIRMLAEVAGRIGRYDDAEKLLRRALELAPGFGAARANLAMVLYKQNRFADAVTLLNDVLAHDPDNIGVRNLKAAALGRVGGYDEALELYAELTQRFPDHAKLWMSYGHMLKTVGRQDECITAYRHALRCDPGLGELWWSLANLKTVSFGIEDRAAMASALAVIADDDPARVDDRLHLHFALGKACDDAGEVSAAFDHYAAANALRAEQLGYDSDETSSLVDRVVQQFDGARFAQFAGNGDPSPDPIFVLGMPRAGSTLVEQILASHSAIEGTQELPDIPALALELGRRVSGKGRGWVEALASLPCGELAELGAEYLKRTAIQRHSDKPFFIDKLPNNWLYLPFIRLALPGARIIDARRHPMDCCFSNFRQHFAHGQAFSYRLSDMGRYYADYVRLMAHLDRVQPGRVHRVIHEALLDNPEQEVRALLAHLDLPFEPACLSFHENRRAVRTASSEQVRRPINRDGVGQWVPYADRLAELRTALGPVLDHYPGIPPEFL